MRRLLWAALGAALLALGQGSAGAPAWEQHKPPPRLDALALLLSAGQAEGEGEEGGAARQRLLRALAAELAGPPLLAGASGDGLAVDFTPWLAPLFGPNSRVLRERVAALPAAARAGAPSTNAAAAFEPISDAEWAAAVAAALTSPLVNEGLTPGARAAERAWQLYRVASDADGPLDCGPYAWSPGGAGLPPRWVGPALTLSSATGACSLPAPTVEGRGSPAWTAAQLARVSCAGPALEWGFAPPAYLGASRARARLAAPACRSERRFGPEVAVRLAGGGGRVRFASRAELLAAVTANGTLTSLKLGAMRAFVRAGEALGGSSTAAAQGSVDASALQRLLAHARRALSEGLDAMEASAAGAAATLGQTNGR